MEIDQFLTRDEMDQLLSSADVFVSLHRSDYTDRTTSIGRIRLRRSGSPGRRQSGGRN